jgi:hypothetical protein
MSNIPYLEQLTNDEVVTASKAATLALQVSNVSSTVQGLVNKLPYRSYVAILNQAGTAAPVATVVYNDISSGLTWSRSTAGTYELTSSSPVFTSGKTIVIINKNFFSGIFPTNQVSDMRAFRFSDTIARLILYASGEGFTDVYIEIRVYN